MTKFYSITFLLFSSSYFIYKNSKILKFRFAFLFRNVLEYGQGVVLCTYFVFRKSNLDFGKKCIVPP